MIQKFVKAVAVLSMGALFLTACGGSDEDVAAGSDTGLDLVEEGTLTVCADVPFPPFAFEKDGDYTGFDIELMRALAEGMDLEPSIKDIGFEGLQSGAALAAGTCDIGAAGMTITEAREKNIDFSDPYYDSLQSLLVGSDSSIKSLDDMSGKKIGVKQGTTGETYAQENAPEDATIISYPSNSEMYPGLKSGGVQAVMMDLPANLQHLEDGEFTIVEEYDTGEQYGFPVQEEGSEKLLKAVNEQLAELKDNGQYEDLYNKYFSEQ